MAGDTKITSVILYRSDASQGFGIAISGGKDNPHFKTGDTSVIVSDIIVGSPATDALQIGDKLISVNEQVIDGRTHEDAVHALKAAGLEARIDLIRVCLLCNMFLRHTLKDISHVRQMFYM